MYPKPTRKSPDEKIFYTTSEASFMPNCAGIYCIRCVVNDQKYVGQASHIRNRLNSHLSALRKGKHTIKDLQGDWNKYGEDAFEIYIVSKCSRDSLNTEEQFWISNLNARYNTIKRVNYFAKREIKETDEFIPGLEKTYIPLKWHKWVYGSGRH